MSITAPVDAAKPTPKTGNEIFFQKHESFLARAQAEPIDLLFLGDSITADWAQAPHIWDHYFGPYQAANFGIGGDQTQHIIWRITQGELDHIHPKVVVLMIGTNNTHNFNGIQIASGIREIIRLIQVKIPQAKILLLGILPRGPRINGNGLPDDWEDHMKVIRTTHSNVAQLDDGDRIRFLDIGSHFLGNDGTIPQSIMPDQLHLTPAGYQLWADAMQPLLKEMMTSVND